MLRISRTKQRIGQLAVGVVSILALLVSSVSACACSHHGPAPEAKKACHGPSHNESSDEKNIDGTSLRQSCACVRPSDERSVKAENFKFKKLAVALTDNAKAGSNRFFLTSDSSVAVRDEHLFEDPDYLTSLSRGPPVL